MPIALAERIQQINQEVHAERAKVSHLQATRGPAVVKQWQWLRLALRMLDNAEASLEDDNLQVLRTIGIDYAEKIVEPELRSAIRGTTASHSANDLYTNGRELVQQQIKDDLVSKLAPRGVIVEDVLLRDVQLPPLLKASIEAKQQAEQDALRMSFILQKEKQEADRKRIEAQGIRDFQTTVAQGISQQLLEWKGIEATERLAASTNAKVVIIGNPKNGLPLVLEPK